MADMCLWMGTLWLRECGTWALNNRRLGLKSTSSSITRPISKSSSGLATLIRRSSVAWSRFKARIEARCRLPLLESNMSEGSTTPSRSVSSSSSSVSVAEFDADDAEVDEMVSTSPKVE